MKKLISTIIIIVVVLIVGFFALNSYIYNEKQGVSVTLPEDFKDITFTISGKPFTLSDRTVKYFGNEVRQDLDDDGMEDIFFLVTQELGGSGTFFFGVGALKREDGYMGTQAVLIGDRISPQTTERGDGRIVIVNYADRAPGEPFTTKPSVGKSLWLMLDLKTFEFGEVVWDFEGESR